MSIVDTPFLLARVRFRSTGRTLFPHIYRFLFSSSFICSSFPSMRSYFSLCMYLISFGGDGPLCIDDEAFLRPGVTQRGISCCLYMRRETTLLACRYREGAALQTILIL